MRKNTHNESNEIREALTSAYPETKSAIENLKDQQRDLSILIDIAEIFFNYRADEELQETISKMKKVISLQKLEIEELLKLK